MKKYNLLIILGLLTFGQSNATKGEGVTAMITTESGLKYEIIKMGEGEKPEKLNFLRTQKFCCNVGRDLKVLRNGQLLSQ